MKRLALAVGVSTRINIFAAEQDSMKRPLKPSTVFFYVDECQRIEGQTEQGNGPRIARKGDDGYGVAQGAWLRCCP